MLKKRFREGLSMVGKCFVMKQDPGIEWYPFHFALKKTGCSGAALYYVNERTPGSYCYLL